MPGPDRVDRVDRVDRAGGVGALSRSATEVPDLLQPRGHHRDAERTDDHDTHGPARLLLEREEDRRQRELIEARNQAHDPAQGGEVRNEASGEVLRERRDDTTA